MFVDIDYDSCEGQIFCNITCTYQTLNLQDYLKIEMLEEIQQQIIKEINNLKKKDI